MARVHHYYVYVLTTKKNTALYTGVTNDLLRRCAEHIEGKNPGFTSRYNVNKLIYFEVYESIKTAIFREKQIKGFSRAKKINLINSLNPEWKDLFKTAAISFGLLVGKVPSINILPAQADSSPPAGGSE